MDTQGKQIYKGKDMQTITKVGVSTKTKVAIGLIAAGIILGGTGSEGGGQGSTK